MVISQLMVIISYIISSSLGALINSSTPSCMTPEMLRERNGTWKCHSYPPQSRPCISRKEKTEIQLLVDHGLMLRSAEYALLQFSLSVNCSFSNSSHIYIHIFYLSLSLCETHFKTSDHHMCQILDSQSL